LCKVYGTVYILFILNFFENKVIIRRYRYIVKDKLD